MPYQAGDLIELDMSQMSLADALPDGTVIGTASTETIDRMGHKVLAGAFDESIKRKGLTGPGGIQLFAFHRRDRPAGAIKALETIDRKLRIAAALNLNISYVKDLYEAVKQTGGLSFSVGFGLQDFRFAEDPVTKEEILVVEKGDLHEISIVTLAAQPEATMDFIKGLDSPSDFERALIQNGWAHGRKEANRLLKLCKASAHLLAPSVPKQEQPQVRPLLDTHQLEAARDLLRKAQASLSSA
jgi:Escherichia/Staphylococcus phage prohead protease